MSVVKKSLNIKDYISDIADIKPMTEKDQPIASIGQISSSKLSVNSVRSSSIKDYISNVESINNKKLSILENPVINNQLIELTDINNLELFPTITESIIVDDSLDNHQQLTKIEVECSPVTNDFIEISTTKDDFYKGLLEQLAELKSIPKIISEDSSTTSSSPTEFYIEKLIESNSSIVTMFEKITTRLEDSHSANLIKDVHDSIISNQRFISENQQILSDNQTTLVENQLFLIETQKSIALSINGLIEKISSITASFPASNPVINISEGGRNITKYVERDKDGLIIKVVESSNIDNQ